MDVQANEHAKERVRGDVRAEVAYFDAETMPAMKQRDVDVDDAVAELKGKQLVMEDELKRMFRAWRRLAKGKRDQARPL